MALIIPVGFSQITLPFLHSSSPREAVITFGVDSSLYEGDFVQMCDDITATYLSTLGNENDSEVTIGPARASVGQDGGPPVAVEGTLANTGDRSQSTLPSNVALLVKKGTSLGGRRGRGRFYIPWIVADGEANDTGIVDGTAKAAFQADATAFLQNLAAGLAITHEVPMYLLHDSSGIGVEPPPSLVTSLVVDGMVATQRRRLGR